ncbi:MAG: hypothetical protein RSB04_10785 [Gordonibacter sp.]|uniref:hypothetical protein n=1 Tax=Gordonibacter sp. TaxID=1968902 RepID=UPI002FC7E46E
MEKCEEHAAHSRDIDRHDKRLDAHGGEIDDIRDCIVRLTALQEAHGAWQERADDRIAALEAKPAKRWETATNYLLTAVIGIVLGLIASQFGIN